MTDEELLEAWRDGDLTVVGCPVDEDYRDADLLKQTFGYPVTIVDLYDIERKAA